ncbi:AAA family ATPase [Pseudogracilibacillus auburnensis]|nr:SMC family ATPase [Pseudogracilibacillus auburnensis]MBO1003630.1 SMC family ATPase [Pseudogracilibacillus auburnensis]
MKPLQLSMTAFGPYKDKEIIDFTKLHDHHLFVISGATGAGKTTIFDAICFALYGTASGSDRENTVMLRSHFADDQIHTAVELLFQLKGRVYRVLRQLGHVKKGNKTRTGERYEFFEQLADGTEIPSVDRQIVSEINEQIERIIGLTQDQFKQIVMLPQGEFRKLLTSETENKEAILRRLFKTERYKQMNTLLKEKKETVHKRFLHEQQMLDHYMNSIHATLERREDSTLFTLLDNEFYNVEQIITSLDEEIFHLKKHITVANKEYTESLNKYEQKQTYYHQTVEINKQFVSLDEKKKEVEILQNKRIEFLRKEQQVAAAKRADQLEPYEQQVRDRRKECLEKENTFNQAIHELEAAEKVVEKTKKAYIEEERKEEERKKLTIDVERFKEFLPSVREMDETKQKLETLQQSITKLTNDISNANSTLKRKESEIDSLKKGLSKKESRMNDRAKKQDQVHNLREKYRVFHEYTKLRKNQWYIQKELEQKESIYKRAEKRYKQYETIWFQNQAAVLASHLHDGDHCPVCGSISHPKKALIDKDQVTKEELDKVKVDQSEKHQAYQAILADFRLCTSKLKEQSQQVATYEVALEHVDTEMENTIQEGQKLSEEVVALDKLAEEIEKEKQSIERLEREVKQAREEKEQFEASLSKQQTEFTTIHATFNERVRNIPENIQDLQQLQLKITETETLKNKLDKQWKEIQAQLQQADKTYTTAQVNVAHAKIELEKIKTIVQQVEALFKERLKEAQFSDEQMYKQAKLSVHERERLKKEIELYKQQIATLQKQIEELSVQLQGKEQVDISVIEEQLKKLKQLYETAFERLNRAKNNAEKAMDIKKNILTVQSEVAALEKEVATVTDLFDVLRGQNMKRISFERFLQIDYLDQIIAAANERFKSLTNGQFYLIRSDRQETHGRQSGLAIDVYDAYTGQNRDVKTLSGGEKFIASLCLALGMSDVIQSFQGNISVETMFIDEGFGSLDEESLHKSIDALISLQQTGRMIGVISHVDELKTVFPAMLEVKKLKEGYSKTKFILK